MTTLKKTSLIDYPTHIVQNLSWKVIKDLSINALKNKNYAELKFIAASTDKIHYIIDDIVDSLDIEAIQAVLEGAKSNKESYIRKGDYISEATIKSLLDSNFYKEISLEETKRKQAEILKILLEAKPTEELTLRELQSLVNILPQQTFEDFCVNKEINLFSDKFEKLEIPYITNGLTPVLVLDEEATNLVDLILSRSFSDKLSASELKKIYIDLYDLHPIAKEMMTLMGTLISQDNNIKIIFTEKSNSHYNPTHNIIRIDSNFKDQTIFNIQSVLIHEIGHYIYYQFNDKASPFNLKPLEDLVREIYADYRESIEDLHMGATLNYKLYKNDTFKEHYKEVLEPFIEIIETYEIAARKPIDKAAELLHINTESYDKYIFTEEYTGWFKESSPIDLFQLNGAAGFRVENCNATSTVVDHIFINILNIYQNEQTTCESNPLKPEATKEEIVKWATEEFLPELINQLGLSPQEIHYLDRIGDYVNRGDHRLDDTNCYGCHDISSININSKKYVELIVRAMEFRAANLGEYLTSAFQELEDFHQMTISPYIDALTANNTLPFYDVWAEDICPASTSYSDYMIVSE